MHRRTTVDPFGRSFDSVKEMCKAHNVSSDTYQTRIAHGYSTEEALNPNNLKNSPLIFRGVTYKSRTAAAKAFGLTYNTFQQRLLNGWDLERALTTPVRTLKRKEKIS